MHQIVVQSGTSIWNIVFVHCGNLTMLIDEQKKFIVKQILTPTKVRKEILKEYTRLGRVVLLKIISCIIFIEFKKRGSASLKQRIVYKSKQTQEKRREQKSKGILNSEQ